MEQQVTRRAVVSGHVQGVFFRDSAREQARTHGLDGWVRNDPRGTVTLLLHGPPDGVEAVLDWVRDGGPPRARVEDVDVAEADPPEGDGFDVRR